MLKIVQRPHLSSPVRPGKVVEDKGWWINITETLSNIGADTWPRPPCHTHHCYKPSQSVTALHLPPHQLLHCVSVTRTMDTIPRSVKETGDQRECYQMTAFQNRWAHTVPSLPISPVVSGALLLAEVRTRSIAPPARLCSHAHTPVDYFRLHIYQQRPGNEVWCRKKHGRKHELTGLGLCLVLLERRRTSLCGLVKEPLAAGSAVRLPLSLLSIATNDVKQLLTHLVTALTELNCYYRHVPPRWLSTGHRAMAPTLWHTRDLELMEQRFITSGLSIPSLVRWCYSAREAATKSWTGISGRNRQKFQNKT